jgi:L-amino acid N-acyltransferase YncA
VERMPWLVCEHRGELLGYAYASPHRVRAAYQWSVDVSVYIHAQARRSGVGRGLYRSLFALLTLQGFYHAYAGITLPNPASVGLHESLGFQPVGVYRSVGYKLGAWHDVGWWQLALQERVPAPEPPLQPGTVRESAAWRAALATGLPYLRFS